MHTGYATWLFVVSVGASALGGALGMAGGIFVVPILTTFGGFYRSSRALVGALRRLSKAV
jgi:uncharacterized membrane protein YfcA